MKAASVACKSAKLPATGAVSWPAGDGQAVPPAMPGPRAPDTLPILTDPTVITCDGTEADLNACQYPAISNEGTEADYYAFPNGFPHRPFYEYDGGYRFEGDCTHAYDANVACADGKADPGGYPSASDAIAACVRDG
jgi:hypothetical protein